MACFALRVLSVLGVSLGLAACASDPTAQAGSDAPAAPIADGDASNDGGVEQVDAAPATVNGCTAADFAANDRTANDADRIIRAPEDGRPAQFTPHCMRVRIGQTVTWSADFAIYSMSYKLVSSTDGGFQNRAATEFVLGDPDGGHTTETATAPEPMTISFTVQEHPTTMFGAVDIVR